MNDEKKVTGANAPQVAATQEGMQEILHKVIYAHQQALTLLQQTEIAELLRSILDYHLSPSESIGRQCYGNDHYQSGKPGGLRQRRAQRQMEQPKTVIPGFVVRPN